MACFPLKVWSGLKVLSEPMVWHLPKDVFLQMALSQSKVL
jgi:hypothetical protein